MPRNFMQNAKMPYGQIPKQPESPNLQPKKKQNMQQWVENWIADSGQGRFYLESGKAFCLAPSYKGMRDEPFV